MLLQLGVVGPFRNLQRWAGSSISAASQWHLADGVPCQLLNVPCCHVGQLLLFSLMVFKVQSVTEVWLNTLITSPNSKVLYKRAEYLIWCLLLSLKYLNILFPRSMVACIKNGSWIKGIGVSLLLGTGYVWEWGSALKNASFLDLFLWWFVFFFPNNSNQTSHQWILAELIAVCNRSPDQVWSMFSILS